MRKRQSGSKNTQKMERTIQQRIGHSRRANADRYNVPVVGNFHNRAWQRARGAYQGFFRPSLYRRATTPDPRS